MAARYNDDADEQSYQFQTFAATVAVVSSLALSGVNAWGNGGDEASPRVLANDSIANHPSKISTG
jgi:hypothetical protein